MKQLTFTVPVEIEQYVKTTAQSVTARLLTLSFHTDPHTFRRSVYIQVALYNTKNVWLRTLEPIIIDPVPDGWLAALDTLDGKVLNAIKGKAADRSSIADGTVGTFDAVKVAEDIAAAEVAKAEAARVEMGEVVK